MRDVVITGATSLIGVALVELLLERGCRVHAVIRQHSSNRNELPIHSKLLIYELDVESIEKISSIVKGPCDVFFHLAWIGTTHVQRTNLAMQQKNIAHTVQAVQVAKKLGCTRFVGVGSQAEYGILSEAGTPETLPHPEEPYGASKLAAYHLSRIAAQQLGMEHVWARVFSVYGPHDNKDTLITALIRQITAGETPQLTKCEQLWDYLYVADAAQALAALAARGKPGRVYCVGSGCAKPLREYVQEIVKVVSSTLQPQFGARAYAQNQVMHLQADIRSLTEDTGFVPTTGFETGILQTVQWLREKGNL